MRKQCLVAIVLMWGIVFSAQASDALELQPVGDEAKLLLRKVSIKMEDTPLYIACEFITSFTNINIEVSKNVAKKSVNLKLANSTVAEALSQITKQTGVVYRLVDGKLQLGATEEMADIDAGKAKFVPYAEDAVKPTVTKKTEAIKTVETETVTKTNETDNNTTLPITEYVIDGKKYTPEELKKTNPKLYDVMTKKKVNPSLISREYVVNGKKYDSLDKVKEDVSPEVYEQLLKNNSLIKEEAVDKELKMGLSIEKVNKE